MRKDVQLPIWLRNGVKPLKNTYPKRENLLVFDTETETGIPYLLIFYDGEKPSYIRVNEDTILNHFMTYLLAHCRNRYSNILFAHNLEFDIGAVFCKKWEENFRYRKPPRIIVYETSKHEKTLGEANLFCQKTWFVQIKLRNGAHVKAVDSNNYIRGSLWKLSRELNFKNRKYERPEFVTEGRKPEDQREWKMLIRYCGREIKATYELARYILDMHKEHDVGYTVSLPHLSSRIFRKHFLHTTIPQLPPYVRNLAELSIHGGRADAFVSTPIVISKVKMYDYNSFYPYAMVNLPASTEGKWISVNRFVDECEGFYRVTGYVKKCRYPILIKSASKMVYANDAYVRNLSVASYELREALINEEFKIEKIQGYIWKPNANAVNSFKDYVEHFYQLKNEADKEGALYFSNKLLLNALYGKTYQTIRLTDYEEEPEYVLNKEKTRVQKNEIKYRGGGLYLPHIGSWITSFCRAKLHSDLHKYEALDCATDSFKTLKTVPEGSELGDLKLVCKGLLLMIRPKLYVIFSEETEKKILENGNLRKWLERNLDTLNLQTDIIKYALHGFWGNIIQLLALYKDKNTAYDFKHMTKIRESLRQKKYPRIMEHGIRTIKVDWKKETGLCGVPKEKALQSLELCNLDCFTCAHNTFTKW